MRFRRVMRFVLAFAAAVALLPADAFASDFRLRVEDLTVAGSPNGYGVVLTDQNSGDENPLEGLMQVTLAPLDANVTWNMTIGMSKPFYPIDGSLAGLFLNSFNITTTSAATIRVTLEDTGFGGNTGPLLMSSSVFGNFCVPNPDPSAPPTCGPNSTVSLSTTSWANTSNYAPALGADSATNADGAVPASLSAIGANAGTSTGTMSFASTDPNMSAVCDLNGFCGESYAAFEDSGPSYSLFTQLIITFSGAGSVDFYQDLTVSPNEKLTPEPGSLMLIVTGAMGFLARRRYAMNV